MPAQFNIAQYLPQRAREAPQRAAVICTHAPDARGRTSLTFGQMNTESDALAFGLRELGLEPGQRTLVMLKPGLDFITLTFALFKLGAVPILIDPGMGKKNLLDCIRQVRPEAFIGIPLAQAARVLMGRDAFKTVRLNITAGRRWFWGGATLDQARARGARHAEPFPLAATTTESPAAILFTTGSTGIPKGVLYLHGMFGAQVDLIRTEYGIEPGEVDLPAFPLFALFSTALGSTCVIPDMDPTRPAQCDPAKIVRAIQQHHVTYTFGSPSIWKRVGPYCIENKITLPGLKRILMAGAPVRGDVLEPFATILTDGGDTFIPYGATESLPVASIRGSEVLRETWALTRQGKGYCVGRPLAGVTVRVLDSRKLDAGQSIAAATCPPGAIGELVVSGPQVTREYFEMLEQTRAAKILEPLPQVSGNPAPPRADQVSAAPGATAGLPSSACATEPALARVWHRLGDMGYQDELGRLWFCGRKAHSVTVADGTTLYSVCVEAIYIELLREAEISAWRTALVCMGSKRAAVVVELPESALSAAQKDRFERLAAERGIKGVSELLYYPKSFPVDIRHNAKINREELGRWAAQQSTVRA